jgi:excisionase family DNA binding protein
VNQPIRYLTPPQVARVLGVSKEHVIKFISNGELRAVNTSLKDRPRWKVSPEDFQAFVNRRSNQAVEMQPARQPKNRRCSGETIKQYV